ncbi:DUF922 domain-containing protein [Aureimonas fodinaquatilis]|uniref:DUF922 domain-containing protein n=1 Tax=Aureimonas fodinaquatilis TaxID=2565783 RepID=A0A5B0E4G3_9HYPH|nr:DUF922 domain-containing protein [Aureimonas fodinaquatilis]KAA0972620.1 DUF922 domain-containing protein [Aureimonas fodinaquatilis]
MKCTVALLCTFGLTLGLASSAIAASVKQRVSYFPIYGNTLEKLEASMLKNGPHFNESASGHPGAATVTFDGVVSYKPTERGCVIDNADFSLVVELSLPKWTNRSGASEETIFLWETFERDVVRHEMHHADIARKWVTKLEMAVRNSSAAPDCETLENAVHRTSERYLKWHEDEQRDYDRKEFREMNLRLKRALRDRLRAGD